MILFLLLEDKDFYEELILQFQDLTNKLSLRETVEEPIQTMMYRQDFYKYKEV